MADGDPLSAARAIVCRPRAPRARELWLCGLLQSGEDRKDAETILAGHAQAVSTSAATQPDQPSCAQAMLLAVDKALPHQVVMLSGDDEYLRRTALTSLLEAACPGGDDFDLAVIEAEDSQPQDWIAEAGTAPFLSARRTVVVRHLLRAGTPADALPSGASVLRTLPTTALLVLVPDEETGDDTKQRRMATIRTAWEKAVKDAKGFVYSHLPDSKTVHHSVREECRRRGLEMQPRAVQVLVEMTGASLGRALEELDKLALFADEASVSESDVLAVVMPSREWNVFHLVDAILQRNVGAALAELRTVVGSAANAQGIANQNIFPQLMRQFRLLWQARLCLEAKTTAERAPELVRACFPDKPNLANEADWQRQKAMRAAGRVSLPMLAECMTIVAETNAQMLGLLPSYTPMESLEQMVLRMVETIQAA